MIDSQTIDEPIPNRSDTTKAVREVYLTHLAHKGIMLNRLNRQLHYGERLQKFAATGNVKDLDAPEGEDMGVNIGNEFHYHIPQTIEQQPADKPESTIAQVADVAAKAKSIWPKILVAASLLSGGTGIGVLISQYLHPAATPAVDTDSDTITEIDFP